MKNSLKYKTKNRPPVFSQMVFIRKLLLIKRQRGLKLNVRMGRYWEQKNYLVAPTTNYIFLFDFPLEKNY